MGGAGVAVGWVTLGLQRQRPKLQPVARRVATSAPPARLIDALPGPHPVRPREALMPPIAQRRLHRGPHQAQDNGLAGLLTVEPRSRDAQRVNQPITSGYESAIPLGLA
jgi:hypothetical protein